MCVNILKRFINIKKINDMVKGFILFIQLILYHMPHIARKSEEHVSRLDKKKKHVHLTIINSSNEFERKLFKIL